MGRVRCRVFQRKNLLFALFLQLLLVLSCVFVTEILNWIPTWCHLFEEIFYILWKSRLGFREETPVITAVIVYYSNPVPIPNHTIWKWTGLTYKDTFSRLWSSHISIFPNRRWFCLRSCKSTKNWSVPVLCTKSVICDTQQIFSQIWVPMNHINVQ